MKLPETLYYTTVLIDGSLQHNPYHTEAQLKQAVRDALEAAAKVCSDECINWDFDKPLLHAESKILRLMEGV
jgi:hypothetical protein